MPHQEHGIVVTKSLEQAESLDGRRVGGGRF